MKPPTDDAQATPGAVQTAGDMPVVSSRQCPVCGAALTGRRAVACSEKCRAIRWRHRREQNRRDRDREIGGLLAQAQRLLQAETKGPSGGGERWSS
jgi:predicted nucleic acid-binding Zn ribbon protein